MNLANSLMEDSTQISVLYIGKRDVNIFLEGQLEIYQRKVSGTRVDQRLSDP